MHVGYILKKFPRISETFILNEILELERQGVEVTIFSLNRPDDGVFHQGLSQLRNPVVYLPNCKSDAMMRVLGERLPSVRAHADPFFDELEDMLQAKRPDVWPILNWGMEMAKLIRERGVDHVHAHFATVAAYVARAANSFCGVSYSVTCHAKDIYRNGIVPENFQSLLRRAAFVVTVCEANRRWIEKELTGDTLPQLRVLYNGVDTSLFKNDAREKGVEPTLLSVGRLVEKKGFHVLIEALAALGQKGFRPRCVLVGDGEEREALARQAEALGVSNIHFLGSRSHGEVRDLMQQATCMVLPCVVGDDGNRDALPTVLLEALASGLPAISTPVGGIEEIIEDGVNGMLVPIGDVEAVAESIEKVCVDGPLMQRFSEAGRKAAEERFDLSRNVNVLRSWQEEACGAVELEVVS